MCYAESERGHSLLSLAAGAAAVLFIFPPHSRAAGGIGETLLGLHGEPNARDLNMQEGMR